MSNLFKPGFQGIKTISSEPYIIDVNSRVIETPPPRVVKPIQNPSNTEDGFKSGISDFAEEVAVAENEELLDDAIDKAKSILDEAKEQAQKILEDAHLQADSIKQQAQEQGYAEGFEKGQAESLKQTNEYVENLKQEKETEILSLQQEMLEDIKDSEQKIIDVACGLIEKLTGILVVEYKPVMFHMINNALNEDDASRNFVIRVSEEQYPYVMDNYDRLSGAMNPGVTIEVFGDKKLSSEQCQIESENGIIDLSMDVQVRNLITAIKLLTE